jgi:hypothetical protein
MALANTNFTDARTQGVGNPLRGFRATIRHDRGVGRRFMLVTVKVLPSLTLQMCTLTSYSLHLHTLCQLPTKVRCVVQDFQNKNILEDTVEQFMYGYEMFNTRLHMEEQWVRIILLSTISLQTM